MESRDELDLALSKLDLHSNKRERHTLGPPQLKAIDLFKQAGRLEDSGCLNQAIPLYSQAFKLEPNVESLLDWQKNSFGETMDAATKSPAKTIRIQGLSIEREAEDKVKFCPILGEVQKEIQDSIPSKVSSLVATDSWLENLPDDLLFKLLKWIGATSVPLIEQVAQASKRLFLATRNPELWSFLIELAHPLANSKDDSQLTTVLKSPRPNRMANLHAPSTPSSPPRQWFFECPRVRTDGLYICKLTYYRPGINEESYYNPIHLIVYYRYIRFFGITDGGYQVWSLVTTDPPEKVLHRLRERPPIEAGYFLTGPIAEDGHPTVSATDYRMGKGSSSGSSTRANTQNQYFGRYYYTLPDSSTIKLILHPYHPPTFHQSQLCPLVNQPQIQFTMVLRIPDASLTHPYQRKALLCQSYTVNRPATIANPTAEAFSMDVSSWSKFYFSRVKSYYT